MLLLLWKVAVSDEIEITIDSLLPAVEGVLEIDTGLVEITIDSVLPSVQGFLDIDSGIALQLDKGSWPQARIDIRIASVLPTPTSRLVIGVHDDDLAVMLLLEEVH